MKRVERGIEQGKVGMNQALWGRQEGSIRERLMGTYVSIGVSEPGQSAWAADRGVAHVEKPSRVHWPDAVRNSGCLFS
jgi:hypothetical protein